MILGFIEHDQGKLNELSLQMLTLARAIANEQKLSLAAILIGENAHALAEELPAYGVSKVYLIQHDRLDDYAPDAWAQSIIHLIDSENPKAVMALGTDRGNEVLARVAARTGLPMAANCTDVQPGNSYLVTRVRYGGNLLEEAYLKGEPKLLTVAPYMIPAEQAPTAAALVLDTITPTLDDKDFRVRVSDRTEAAKDGISLADARVVVGGGRGVSSAAAFSILEDLADLLGGAVGASRVITNLGWRPHSDQVGQTGTRIAPDIYIACGISGAIQHMAGCMGAKRILVINTDSEAPIVSKADYLVVGDLHEVVPALCTAIKNMRATV